MKNSLSDNVTLEFYLFSLQSQYNDDCLMWDFMAKRELDAAVAPELQSAKGRASDTDRKEEHCCLVYEEALKSLNAGNKDATETFRICIYKSSVTIQRWNKSSLFYQDVLCLLMCSFSFL